MTANPVLDTKFPWILLSWRISTNGRTGVVRAGAGGIEAAAAGLRETRFALVRGGGDVFRLPSPAIKIHRQLLTAAPKAAVTIRARAAEVAVEGVEVGLILL